jgi:hypothetical protein
MGRFVASSQWLQESKQALPIESLEMTSKNTKEACEAIKVMHGFLRDDGPNNERARSEVWVRVPPIQIFKTTIRRGKNPFSPL